MSKMENVFVKAEELATDVKEYVNNRIAYAKLGVAEKSSKLLSQLITVAVLAIVLLFILIFGSASAAYALSAWIGQPYSGFLIVAGFYLLIGIIIWIARDRMLRIPIMNSLIRILFTEEEQHHEKN